MTTFHLLRPFALIGFLPLIALAWRLRHHKRTDTNWTNVCDPHLLPHVVHTECQIKQQPMIVFLITSLAFALIGLAGPTWFQYPVPSYHDVHPRVILLNLSDAMNRTDLTPSRLQRAKFKIHDLLQQKDAGLFGLVAYTSEPFIVSPLTEDGRTIDALLPPLTADIMPVEGDDLSLALKEAAKLITNAGFKAGDLFILTSTIPSKEAVRTASTLADQGMHTSVLPVQQDLNVLASFEPLAKAGDGMVLPFTNDKSDLTDWLTTTHAHSEYAKNTQTDCPRFREEGRWFLIPALCALCPLFRQRRPA